MHGGRLPLVRRSDLASALVYLLLLAVVAGSLVAAWPSGGLPEASTARKVAVAVLGATLAFALLFGVPAMISALLERRRVVALAGILRGRECRACGGAYDPAAVDRTAYVVSPLCSGEPELEDLRPRWMVQCASCGTWAGFGDDGEPIDGGVVPVPADDRPGGHSGTIAGRLSAADRVRFPGRRSRPR